ncbi:hypothetical protein L2E82_11715 [Cichorium intybus]|uniref:Uncharacterized protein n=1 Tax=Cichorium intybus TaxID=13427 RepID=A0ACB9GES9_CICIN|nr:hypothetical protein L2E82_11715 [Cichorium intybus]
MCQVKGLHEVEIECVEGRSGNVLEIQGLPFTNDDLDEKLISGKCPSINKVEYSSKGESHHYGVELEEEEEDEGSKYDE